jgi:putative ABC transport system substrate-binding protein
MKEASMTHRTMALCITLALGFLVAPFATDAQPPGAIARVGVLGAGFPPAPSVRAAFLQALRELGWVEGQNLVIERRWTEEHDDRLPLFAAKLVRLPVDVLVTVGSPATAAAQQATTTIPIVMVNGGDPVGAGFITSLARPGGNITGTAWTHPEIAGKLQELLLEVVPQARRIAVMVNPAALGTQIFAQANAAAARARGLLVQAIEVRHPSDVGAALVHLAHHRPEALYVVVDPVVDTHRQQILAFAAEHRVPAIYTAQSFVEPGGLMFYGPSQREITQRTAVFIDKLLKGVQPADLPVEQPMTWELVINLKTAHALDLTVPPSLLVQATEVIR